MAGYERQSLIRVPVGDGDAGIGESSDSCGYSRRYADLDSCPNQSERFLAAAAENERVAALQPGDALSLAGKINQPKRNIALRRRRPAASFASKNQFSVASAPFENLRIRESVVDNGIRYAQCVVAVKRHQPGIPGSRADQPYEPGHEFGLSGDAKRPLGFAGMTVFDAVQQSSPDSLRRIRRSAADRAEVITIARTVTCSVREFEQSGIVGRASSDRRVPKADLPGTKKRNQNNAGSDQFN